MEFLRLNKKVVAGFSGEGKIPHNLRLTIQNSDFGVVLDCSISH